MQLTGLIGFGASAGGAGTPTRSLDFVAASSRSLSLSTSNFGLSAMDRAKWTLSVWFKLASTGTVRTLAGIGLNTDAAATLGVQVNAADKLRFLTSSDGASTGGQLITTATYTSTSAFYHLLLHYDSANGTAGDRMRMWVNGGEVTTFDTDTAPSAAIHNASGSVYWGANYQAGQFFDGLLYQPTFVSGLLVPIDHVYNAGAARDLSELANLWSLLNTNATDALEDDFVKSTNWTNTNSVVKDATIP